LRFIGPASAHAYGNARIDFGKEADLAWTSAHPAKEIPMSKVLKCSDVNPGCNHEIRGDSEHDVLRKAAEHAKKDHNMDSIPPDMLSKVKSAIHDEGEARSQKAGSTS
jgi:predicted small metal-binding protein